MVMSGAVMSLALVPASSGVDRLSMLPFGVVALLIVLATTPFRHRRRVRWPIVLGGCFVASLAMVLLSNHLFGRAVGQWVINAPLAPDTKIVRVHGVPHGMNGGLIEIESFDIAHYRQLGQTDALHRDGDTEAKLARGSAVAWRELDGDLDYFEDAPPVGEPQVLWRHHEGWLYFIVYDRSNGHAWLFYVPGTTRPVFRTW